MIPAITTAVSGLNAASTRIGVSAQNIANQGSTSQLVNGQVVSQPYQAQEVDQVSLSDGGVEALAQASGQPTTQIPNPDGQGGLFSVPNVDPTTELVNMQTASYDFKANLNTIKVADQMQQSLLNIVS